MDSNITLMIKTHENDNQRLLIIDPVTGIVRDMTLNETISGNYCFSDLQTEWVSDLCEEILDNAMDLSMLSVVPPLVMFNNPFTLEPTFTGFFVSLGINPSVAEALAGSTRLARNPLSAALVATFILTFVGGYYICETYDLKPAPRNLEEDLEYVMNILTFNLADREHLPPDYKNPKETLNNMRDALNLAAAGIGADPGDKDLLKQLKESFKKQDWEGFANGLGQAFRKSGSKLIEGLKNGDLVAVAVSTSEISTLITITGSWLIYESISALGDPPQKFLEALYNITNANNTTGG